MHKKNIKRNLNWIKISASLISLHYGLGFLLGSGEAIYQKGSIGILYAVSSALGLFSLFFISNFYWINKKPIWDLFTIRYNKSVGSFIAFLSGSWMLGIIGSQILAAGHALYIFGFPLFWSMLFITTIILFVSCINIDKLSKIFFIMLIFSSVLLILILKDLGFAWFPISILDLLNNLQQVDLDNFVGISTTTILITFLGMDFHQFIVAAKSPKHSKLATIVSGMILLTIAFLILSIVNASINNGLVQGLSNPAQVVPIILYNYGNSISHLAGVFFSLPIVFVSIGSAGGVAKITSETVMSLSFIPKWLKKHKLNNLLTIILAFLIALTGKGIVELLVSFYAIYISSILLPFIVYVIETKYNLNLVSANTVKLSLINTSLVSICILVLSLLPWVPFPYNTATSIILLGMLTSSLTLVVKKALRYFKN